MFYRHIKQSYPFRILTAFLVMSFALTGIVPPSSSAQPMIPLPPPGLMISPTPGFAPALIKGVRIFADNPLKFDFIIDTGHSDLKDEALREEADRLVKYFLATLTVPKEELWVNLSPYEKDRIIPEAFGVTEMGRDLLAQDYILKQLTASLVYPEKELGKKFWKRIQKSAYERFGTTDIPVNTFNKVWIVPEKAVVYEHQDSAFVVESRLKVMLEKDYLAAQKSYVAGTSNQQPAPSDNISLEILREIIIPEIEKEVNEGENFANLRQIYHSMILATWFKRNLKQSILNKIYVDQNKVEGVDVEDKDIKNKIYQQYLEAFKTGVYNYIKEDYDPTTQEIVPRKYFSGGARMGDVLHQAIEVSQNPAYALTVASDMDNAMVARVGLKLESDQAMTVVGDITEQYLEAARHSTIQIEMAERLGVSIETVRRRLVSLGIKDEVDAILKRNKKEPYLEAARHSTTQTEIATRLDVDRTTVYRQLSSLGIKDEVIEILERNKKEAYNEAYNEAYLEAASHSRTQAEMAERLGVSINTVRHWLVSLGIKDKVDKILRMNRYRGLLIASQEPENITDQTVDDHAMAARVGLLPEGDEAMATDALEYRPSLIGRDGGQRDGYLKINGSYYWPYKALGRNSVRDIFFVGDEVYRISRMAKMDLSEDTIATIKAIGHLRAAPELLDSGWIEIEANVAYEYLKLERVYGDNFLKITNLNDSHINALKVLLKTLIKEKILIGDFDPENVTFGYTSKDPTERAYVVDVDSAQDFSAMKQKQGLQLTDIETERELIEYYKYFFDRGGSWSEHRGVSQLRDFLNSLLTERGAASVAEGSVVGRRDHAMVADDVEAAVIESLSIDEDKLYRSHVLINKQPIVITQFKSQRLGIDRESQIMAEAVPFFRVGRFIVIPKWVLKHLDEDVVKYPGLIVIESKDFDKTFFYPNPLNFANYGRNTMGILAAMAAYADRIKGSSFVDLGASETGLLAIAASKLGASEIIVVEQRHELVDLLRKNLRENGVERFSSYFKDASAINKIETQFPAIFAVNEGHFTNETRELKGDSLLERGLEIIENPVMVISSGLGLRYYRNLKKLHKFEKILAETLRQKGLDAFERILVTTDSQDAPGFDLPVFPTFIATSTDASMMTNRARILDEYLDNLYLRAKEGDKGSSHKRYRALKLIAAAIDDDPKLVQKRGEISEAQRFEIEQRLDEFSIPKARDVLNKAKLNWLRFWFYNNILKELEVLLAPVLAEQKDKEELPPQALLTSIKIHSPEQLAFTGNDFPYKRLREAGQPRLLYAGLVPDDMPLDMDKIFKGMGSLKDQYQQLQFVRQAMAELLVNAMDLSGGASANFKIIYFPKIRVLRLMIEQETTREEFWQQLKKNWEGFRLKRAGYLTPEERMLMEKWANQGLGLTEFAQLLDEAPARLLYRRDKEAPHGLITELDIHFSFGAVIAGEQTGLSGDRAMISAEKELLIEGAIKIVRQLDQRGIKQVLIAGRSAVIVKDLIHRVWKELNLESDPPTVYTLTESLALRYRNYRQGEDDEAVKDEIDNEFRRLGLNVEEPFALIDDVTMEGHKLYTMAHMIKEAGYESFLVGAFVYYQHYRLDQIEGDVLKGISVDWDTARSIENILKFRTSEMNVDDDELSLLISEADRAMTAGGHLTVDRLTQTETHSHDLLHSPLAELWANKLEGALKPLLEGDGLAYHQANMTEEIWNRLSSSLSYLIGAEYYKPRWVMEDPDLKGLKRPTDLEDFTYIGQRVNEFMQPKGFLSVLPYLSLLDGDLIEPENTFMDVAERTDALTRAGSIEERGLALLVNGIKLVTHLRFLGVHAEADANREPQWMDNEILVKTIRNFIPLLIRWKSEFPESWNALLPSEHGYEGKSLGITYGDVMQWALIVMLDPMIHNFELSYKTARHNINRYNAEYIHSERAVSWETGLDSMTAFMERMFERFDGVEDQEVEALIAEAIQHIKKGKIKRAMRPPLRVITSPNYQTTINRLISSKEKPLPIAFDPLAIVLKKPQLLPFIVEKNYVYDIDEVGKRLYHSIDVVDSQRKAPMRFKQDSDAELLASYIEVFSHGTLKERFPRILQEFKALADAAMTGKNDAATQRIEAKFKKWKNARNIDVIKGGKHGYIETGKELLQLVDENGRIIRQGASRTDVHQKGLWHMVSLVFMIDPQGRIVLQKRAQQKRTSFGKLHIPVSGHVDFAETPLKAALREGKEELGIRLDPKKIKSISALNAIRRSTRLSNGTNNEFLNIYFYPLSQEEFDQIVKQYNLNEIEELWLMPIVRFEQMISEDADMFTRTLQRLMKEGRDIYNRFKEASADAAMLIEGEELRSYPFTEKDVLLIEYVPAEHIEAEELDIDEIPESIAYDDSDEQEIYPTKHVMGRFKPSEDEDWLTITTPDHTERSFYLYRPADFPPKHGDKILNVKILAGFGQIAQQPPHFITPEGFEVIGFNASWLLAQEQEEEQWRPAEYFYRYYDQFEVEVDGSLIELVVESKSEKGLNIVINHKEFIEDDDGNINDDKRKTFTYSHVKEVHFEDIYGSIELKRYDEEKSESVTTIISSTGEIIKGRDEAMVSVLDFDYRLAEALGIGTNIDFVRAALTASINFPLFEQTFADRLRKIYQDDYLPEDIPDKLLKIVRKGLESYRFPFNVHGLYEYVDSEISKLHQNRTDIPTLNTLTIIGLLLKTIDWNNFRREIAYRMRLEGWEVEKRLFDSKNPDNDLIFFLLSAGWRKFDGQKAADSAMVAEELNLHEQWNKLQVNTDKHAFFLKSLEKAVSAGWKQKEIAHEAGAGVSRPEITLILAGKRGASLEFQEKVLQALDRLQMEFQWLKESLEYAVEEKGWKPLEIARAAQKFWAQLTGVEDDERTITVEAVRRIQEGRVVHHVIREKLILFLDGIDERFSWQEKMDFLRDQIDRAQELKNVSEQKIADAAGDGISARLINYIIHGQNTDYDKWKKIMRALEQILKEPLFEQIEDRAVVGDAAMLAKAIKKINDIDTLNFLSALRNVSSGALETEEIFINEEDNMDEITRIVEAIGGEMLAQFRVLRDQRQSLTPIFVALKDQLQKEGSAQGLFEEIKSRRLSLKMQGVKAKKKKIKLLDKAVLIVEEDAIIRRQLDEIVRDEFDTVSVVSEAEAIEELKSRPRFYGAVVSRKATAARLFQQMEKVSVLMPLVVVLGRRVKLDKDLRGYNHLIPVRTSDIPSAARQIRKQIYDAIDQAMVGDQSGRSHSSLIKVILHPNQEYPVSVDNQTSAVIIFPLTGLSNITLVFSKDDAGSLFVKTLEGRTLNMIESEDSDNIEIENKEFLIKNTKTGFLIVNTELYPLNFSLVDMAMAAAANGEDLGRRLKQAKQIFILQKVKGLKGSWVAQQLGVSDSHLRAIASGRKIADQDFLKEWERFIQSIEAIAFDQDRREGLAYVIYEFRMKKRMNREELSAYSDQFEGTYFSALEIGNLERADAGVLLSPERQQRLVNLLELNGLSELLVLVIDAYIEQAEGIPSGSELKAMRQEKGYSEQWAWEQLGISRSQLYQLEKDASNEIRRNLRQRYMRLLSKTEAVAISFNPEKREALARLIRIYREKHGFESQAALARYSQTIEGAEVTRQLVTDLENREGHPPNPANQNKIVKLLGLSTIAELNRQITALAQRSFEVEATDEAMAVNLRHGNQMLKNIKAVVIDWDNTFWQTEKTRSGSWIPMQAQMVLQIWHGTTEVDDIQRNEALKFVWSKTGFSEAQRFQFAIDEAPAGNLSGKSAEEWAEEHRQWAIQTAEDEIPLWKDRLDELSMPGVLDLVDKLIVNDIPVIIATSNPWLVPTDAVQQLGGGDKFDGVFGPGSPEFPSFEKADVVAFVKEKYAKKEGDVLMIGDGRGDLFAAQKGGARFAGVVPKNETEIEALFANEADMLFQAPDYFKNLSVEVADAAMAARKDPRPQTPDSRLKDEAMVNSAVELFEKMGWNDKHQQSYAKAIDLMDLNEGDAVLNVGAGTSYQEVIGLAVNKVKVTVIQPKEAGDQTALLKSKIEAYKDRVRGYTGVDVTQYIEYQEATVQKANIDSHSVKGVVALNVVWFAARDHVLEQFFGKLLDAVTEDGFILMGGFSHQRGTTQVELFEQYLTDNDVGYEVMGEFREKMASEDSIKRLYRVKGLLTEEQSDEAMAGELKEDFDWEPGDILLDREIGFKAELDSVTPSHNEQDGSYFLVVVVKYIPSGRKDVFSIEEVKERFINTGEKSDRWSRDEIIAFIEEHHPTVGSTAIDRWRNSEFEEVVKQVRKSKLRWTEMIKAAGLKPAHRSSKVHREEEGESNVISNDTAKPMKKDKKVTRRQAPKAEPKVKADKTDVAKAKKKNAGIQSSRDPSRRLRLLTIQTKIGDPLSVISKRRKIEKDILDNAKEPITREELFLRIAQRSHAIPEFIVYQSKVNADILLTPELFGHSNLMKDWTMGPKERAATRREVIYYLLETSDRQLTFDEILELIIQFPLFEKTTYTILVSSDFSQTSLGDHSNRVKKMPIKKGNTKDLAMLGENRLGDIDLNPDEVDEAMMGKATDDEEIIIQVVQTFIRSFGNFEFANKDLKRFLEGRLTFEDLETKTFTRMIIEHHIKKSIIGSDGIERPVIPNERVAQFGSKDMFRVVAIASWLAAKYKLTDSESFITLVEFILALVSHEAASKTLRASTNLNVEEISSLLHEAEALIRHYLEGKDRQLIVVAFLAFYTTNIVELAKGISDDERFYEFKYLDNRGKRMFEGFDRIHERIKSRPQEAGETQDNALLSGEEDDAAMAGKKESTKRQETRDMALGPGPRKGALPQRGFTLLALDSDEAMEGTIDARFANVLGTNINLVRAAFSASINVPLFEQTFPEDLLDIPLHDDLPKDVPDELLGIVREALRSYRFPLDIPALYQHIDSKIRKLKARRTDIVHLEAIAVLELLLNTMDWRNFRRELSSNMRVDESEIERRIFHSLARDNHLVSFLEEAGWPRLEVKGEEDSTMAAQEDPRPQAPDSRQADGAMVGITELTKENMYYVIHDIRNLIRHAISTFDYYEYPDVLRSEIWVLQAESLKRINSVDAANDMLRKAYLAFQEDKAEQVIKRFNDQLSGEPIDSDLKVDSEKRMHLFRFTARMIRLLSGSYISENLERPSQFSLNDTLRIYALSKYNENIKFIFEAGEIAISGTEAHELALFQIMMNLLNNAMRFIDKKEGGITVRTKRSPIPGFVYVEVEDDGKGIAPESIGHIFEPGWFMKQHEDEDEEGRGYGLAIVKRLVEEILKGTIEVKSELGKGTKFTIHFPLPDAAMTGHDVGGIDLNPDMLELQTQGQGIEMNFTPAQLETMPITGFSPIIYSITPVTNLPLLLGIADDMEPEPLAEGSSKPYELSKADRRERILATLP